MSLGVGGFGLKDKHPEDLDETGVTLAMALYLRSNHWTIKSLNNPRAQAPLRLFRLGRKRASGSIVPDIIAQKGSEVMLVESKPRFSMRDYEKYSKFGHEFIEHAVKRVLSLSPSAEIRIRLAHAVNRASTRAIIPEDLEVYVVKPDGVIRYR
jgi:hypothetical protein